MHKLEITRKNQKLKICSVIADKTDRSLISHGPLGMATFPVVGWEYPGRSLGISCQNSRIPDRRVEVMKYRSGNARAATRGGFAFQFLDRIPSVLYLYSLYNYLCISITFLGRFCFVQRD